MYILHPLTVDVDAKVEVHTSRCGQGSKAHRTHEHDHHGLAWLLLCPDTKFGPYPALRCAK